MTKRHVTIYERRGPRSFWLVDAMVASDGGVRICSGDGRAEWYAIVDADAKGALLAALRTRAKPPQRPSSADDEILELLVRAFSRRIGRRHAPFREITAFLDRNRIPWRSDFWGDM